MSLSVVDSGTALVVVDLQKSVLQVDTKPFSTADVLGRNVQLADTFRSHNLPVVLVRTTGRPAGRCDSTQPARHRPSVLSGPDAATIDSTLCRGPHHIVTKKSWSAFTGTDLHRNLQHLGVTQIVVTGIATSLGVESTARAGLELGYHVSLITDAMTDRDPELHHSSTTKIFPRLGETGRTGDLIRLLG